MDIVWAMGRTAVIKRPGSPEKLYNSKMHAHIILSKGALIQNIQQIRQAIGQAKKIIAVVKANAYGHGLKEVVESIETQTDAFAIDDIQELIALRKLTDKDIYVLGYVCREDLSTLIQNNGIPVVYDSDTLKYINTVAENNQKTIGVNIKIDAYLGRQGVLVENVGELLDTLKNCPHLQLRGVYSHFSNIEDVDNLTHAQKQIETFRKALQIVDEHGYTNYEKHISSTAGILLYEHSAPDYTHVRLGIGLYGLWPSQKVQERVQEGISLVQVLTWTSCIAQVKTVPKDFPIGYGCTYITERETTIGIVPQGYSDGYDRSLSNKGEMLVGGKRCPILGRVAMNMCVIDVSGVEGVTVEDEVVLIGSQGDETISADYIAVLTDTIAYEVVARISPFLRRRIV